MFSEIISDANLRAAYLKIVEQFTIEGKSASYHGLDNLLLEHYDLRSEELLLLIREELVSEKEISPALLVKIPKKNNPEKNREIFIYSLKERIKAQAIFQIVLPVFEKNFSDRLFSYRPGKPPYLAAKYFGHRYRRDFSQDYALIIDLENYSDLIDRQLLSGRLEEIFSDQKVLAVLRLFIFNCAYRDGKMVMPQFGLIQGVPLIAEFANFYLSDLDFKYQKLVPFYLRVGDDIAILDQNDDKLEVIKKEMSADLLARKLRINENKLYCGPAKSKFSFLGYCFEGGLISLEQGYLRRIETEWKKLLSYKHLPDKRKDYLLRKIMIEEKNNFNFRFEKIIKDKPQINDSKQIRDCSERFFQIMTKFFYGHYSPRNRRLLEKRLGHLGIFSLYHFYKKFHYERN
ncbi:MAG: reverse transcriptase domain-containing protein [Candidatus Falkowbacteria bacterium]|nr:reverse transcriptase domain-containing protein [Candidatus Falkowbacteria bacterium]